jgi:SagB-type dehydrogenase family enzyme
VSLPSPELPSGLAELLAGRTSCRRFATEEVLDLTGVGSVLHAAYGILGHVGGRFRFDHRPVPSAGACYPLTLFLVARSVEGLTSGTYLYEPSGFLAPVGPRPQDLDLAEILLDQPYCALAPALVFLGADMRPTLERYGDRGYRYVLFEAGHIAQNMMLCATGIGISTLPVGGFLDARVSSLIGHSGVIVPLYGMALGHPQAAAPETLRMPD